VTYRSAAEWQQRFGRQPIREEMKSGDPFASEFAVQGYLEALAQRFVSYFDANSRRCCSRRPRDSPSARDHERGELSVCDVARTHRARDRRCRRSCSIGARACSVAVGVKVADEALRQSFQVPCTANSDANGSPLFISSRIGWRPKRCCHSAAER